MYSCQSQKYSPGFKEQSKIRKNDVPFETFTKNIKVLFFVILFIYFVKGIRMNAYKNILISNICLLKLSTGLNDLLF